MAAKKKRASRKRSRDDADVSKDSNACPPRKKVKKIQTPKSAESNYVRRSTRKRQETKEYWNSSDTDTDDSAESSQSTFAPIVLRKSKAKNRKSKSNKNKPKNKNNNNNNTYNSDNENNSISPAICDLPNKCKDLMNECFYQNENLEKWLHSIQKCKNVDAISEIATQIQSILTDHYTLMNCEICINGALIHENELIPSKLNKFKLEMNNNICFVRDKNNELFTNLNMKLQTINQELVDMNNGNGSTNQEEQYKSLYNESLTQIESLKSQIEKWKYDCNMKDLEIMNLNEKNSEKLKNLQNNKNQEFEQMKQSLEIEINDLNHKLLNCNNTNSSEYQELNLNLNLFELITGLKVEKQRENGQFYVCKLCNQLDHKMIEFSLRLNSCVTDSNNDLIDYNLIECSNIEQLDEGLESEMTFFKVKAPQFMAKLINQLFRNSKHPLLEK